VSNFSLSDRERSPRPGEPGRRSRRQHWARGEPRTWTAPPPVFPRRRASTIRGYAAAISPRFIPRLPLVRRSAARPRPPFLPLHLVGGVCLSTQIASFPSPIHVSCSYRLGFATKDPLGLLTALLISKITSDVSLCLLIPPVL